MWSISHSWPHIRCNRNVSKCSKSIDLIKHISLHRLDRVMEQHYTHFYIYHILKKQTEEGRTQNIEWQQFWWIWKIIQREFVSSATGFFCLSPEQCGWNGGRKSVQRHHLITFYVRFFLLIKQSERRKRKKKRENLCWQCWLYSRILML